MCLTEGYCGVILLPPVKAGGREYARRTRQIKRPRQTKDCRLARRKMDTTFKMFSLWSQRLDSWRALGKFANLLWRRAPNWWANISLCNGNLQELRTDSVFQCCYAWLNSLWERKRWRKIENQTKSTKLNLALLGKERSSAHIMWSVM